MTIISREDTDIIDLCKTDVCDLGSLIQRQTIGRVNSVMQIAIYSLAAIVQFVKSTVTSLGQYFSSSPQWSSKAAAIQWYLTGNYSKQIIYGIFYLIRGTPENLDRNNENPFAMVKFLLKTSSGIAEITRTTQGVESVWYSFFLQKKIAKVSAADLSSSGTKDFPSLISNARL